MSPVFFEIENLEFGLKQRGDNDRGEATGWRRQMRPSLLVCLLASLPMVSDEAVHTRVVMHE